MTDQPVADNPEADDVGVLTGIGVVELTRWIAGPSAGGLLADWVADAIKVEPPTGDPQRIIFGSLGYGDLPVPGFALDNRAKRSVALGLATADAYLTSMGPNSLEAMTHRTP